MAPSRFVIPAEAGTQPKLLWIPAFAGMTVSEESPSHNFDGVELSASQYVGAQSTRFLQNVIPSEARNLVDTLRFLASLGMTTGCIQAG